MDGHRFDDLSRKLATGVSRRAALTGAAAGLLRALGLRQRADAQVTQAQCGNKACRRNPGKCDPDCVCCVYGNGNSRCTPSGACGTGGRIVCPDDRPNFDPELGRCVAACVAACEEKACGAGDGCGGVCQTGSCPEGRSCANGGCFRRCSVEDGSACQDAGPNCGCVLVGRTFEEVCGDVGTFRGTCAVNGDTTCPTGTACSSAGRCRQAC